MTDDTYINFVVVVVPGLSKYVISLFKKLRRRNVDQFYKVLSFKKLWNVGLVKFVVKFSKKRRNVEFYYEFLMSKNDGISRLYCE